MAQLAAELFASKTELLFMKQCGQTFCTDIVQPLSQTLVTFRAEVEVEAEATAAGSGFA